METPHHPELHGRDALRALREELGRLAARVATLEAAQAAPGGARPVTGIVGAATPTDPAGPAAIEGAPVQVAPPVEVEPSEEVLAVIAAAVAAYLGHKPRLKHVWLDSASTWAQQGRVSIQASHALAPHGR